MPDTLIIYGEIEPAYFFESTPDTIFVSAAYVNQSSLYLCATSRAVERITGNITCETALKGIVASQPRINSAIVTCETVLSGVLRSLSIIPTATVSAELFLNGTTNIITRLSNAVIESETYLTGKSVISSRLTGIIETNTFLSGIIRFINRILTADRSLKKESVDWIIIKSADNMIHVKDEAIDIFIRDQE